MQTIDSLTTIFRDVFDAPALTITPETTADDIEDWDSVAQVNLVLTIESVFQVRFSMEEATETNSVAGFIEAIERHL
jgi:acyl carrier protein